MMTQHTTTTHRTAEPPAPASIDPSGDAWSRATPWLWVVFLGWVTLNLTGAFPAGPNAADGLQEAVGVDHIMRYGWDGPLLTHNFVGCSGTTMLLLTVSRLTGADPFVVYSIVCAVSGALFVLAVGGFVARWVRLPVPLCGMLAYTFPESIVCGTYTNDTVLPAAFVALAFYILSGRLSPMRLVSGSICLGLAGWFRADIVLVTPALLFILYRKDRTAFVRSFLCVAVISGAIALGGVYLSGSSIQKILGHAGAVLDDDPPLVRIAACYVSFFSLVGLLLLATGAIRLVRDRSWKLLALAVAGALPLYATMFNNPNPKYFFYMVPALLIVAAYGAWWLLSARSPATRILRVAAVVLFVGQYVLGLQVALTDRPWLWQPVPNVARLYSHDFSSGPLSRASLVIGPGAINPFGHGQRLTSGFMFLPITWRTLKDRPRIEQEKLNAYIDALETKELSFFSNTHAGGMHLGRALVRSGYECIEMIRLDHIDSWRYRWRRGEQLFTHFRIGGSTYDMTFIRSLNQLRGVYVVGSGREERAMLAQTVSSRKICGIDDITNIAAYEVVFPPLDEVRNAAP